DQRRQALKLHTQLTQDVVKNLKRVESAHFVIYLDDKRDGILAPYALDTLEKSYEAIGAELGYYPKEKVRVEIAPDATSFNAISTRQSRCNWPMPKPPPPSISFMRARARLECASC